MLVTKQQLKRLYYQKKIEEDEKLRKRLDSHLFYFAEYVESIRNGFFTRDKPHLIILSMLFDLIDEDIIWKMTASMPPRAGKSYSASLAILQQICKHPERSNMRNSYSADLAVKILSFFVRESLKDERLYYLYNVRLNRNAQSKEKWMLEGSNRPVYSASGVGGTSSGIGVDNYLVLDDEYSGISDALSMAIRRQTDNWVSSVHLARLEKGGKELYLCTRWIKNDHIGQVKKYDKTYDVDIEKYYSMLLNCGEITDDKFELVYQELKKDIVANVDDDTFVTYTVPAIITVDGEEMSFSPSQFSLDYYINKRESYKRRGQQWIWEAVFMQNPANNDSKIFTKLNRFTKSQINGIIRGEEYYVVSYIDPAFEKGGNKLAMPIAIYIDDKFYIIDVEYSNAGVEFTIPEITEKLNKHNVSYIEYEMNNGGEKISLKIEKRMNEKGYELPVFKGVNNRKDKVVRIALSFGDIAEKCYFLQEDEYPSKQYRDYVKEILTVNLNLDQDYDDGIDATAGLVTMKISSAKNSSFVSF